MKNKVLALLLALVMALSLAACGSTTAQTTNDAHNDAQNNAEEQAETAPEETADAAETAPAEDAGSDLAYVMDKGTLIVGITEFEPMDYQSADGSWIGFDADMAAAFAASLGVTPQFQIIDWDNKVFELNGKTIDVVWNGMTLTDEVRNSMECSNPYFNNAQVVIVPADKADQYQDVESLKDLSFAVEAGSAGQKQAAEYGLNYTEVQDQATALLETSSGTADAAIVDFLMAKAMTGEGTSYANLTHTVSLNSEEYGVGFRQGSDLAAVLNAFFALTYADGTMADIAETYHIAEQLVAQEEPVADAAAETVETADAAEEAVETADAAEEAVETADAAEEAAPTADAAEETAETVEEAPAA